MASFAASVPQRSAPTREELCRLFVGKTVGEVPKPAAIMDVAVARRNCAAVDKAVAALGVGFRAHIKTHKTTELTRLQVQNLGPSQPINLVASTLAEIEHLVPLIAEYASAGRSVNILYGIPLPPSQVSRLAHIARRIGVPGSISVLVDHPAQLEPLATTFHDTAGFPVKVFIKVDTGYHRAGLPPAALNKGGLIDRIAQLNTKVEFLGLYSHSSLSYNGNTPRDAMDALAGEIDGCMQALRDCGAAFASLAATTTSQKQQRQLVISVGASPQIISVGNLLSSSSSSSSSSAADSDSANLRRSIAAVSSSPSSSTDSSSSFTTTLELHAGVYAVRDIQQLATNAVPPSSSPSSGTASETTSSTTATTTTTAELYHIDEPEAHVAFSVAAEVCSVYNDHERAEPEALIAVGVLGLGREPCKMYPGWGILGTQGVDGSGSGGRRIMISRISQEHGIAAWLPPTSEAGAGRGARGEEHVLPPLPLEVGQVVRVYPNHACITGAMYGWYLVVDSDEKDPGAGEVVRDVWVRASGW
ncbi:putative serine dehydratase domain-containing protein [Microdochium trichocladiopsis]|uniref:Serine dehydratase domain-containing protein n=1 Tax=Microdochium trichocladiopsis TaxID=1682393 RepID=A0A9P9BUW0_9PEZI|nr:putative serine dehydratase domain-containing protein [Microdochium trichocladiopsis]KAH7032697.1 putative serine dehydratase domain-containing protein [Microdochium trichocladiopsis]